MNIVQKSLNIYFKNRPAFLGLIRCKEIELLAKNIDLDKSKKLKILDFGAGDGFFLHVLSQFTDLAKHEIIGVDVQDGGFENAISYDLYSKLIKYDGKNLDFKDNTFDLVISNCVLEHVDDLDGNISEISRVMKKEAKFHTTVMSAQWDNYLFGSILLGDRYTKWMRKRQIHKNLLTNIEWQKAFEKASLKVKKEVGYIDKKTGRLFDFMHYVSAPTLFNKAIFKKWILFPKLVDIFGFDKWFAKKYAKDVLADSSAVIYYVLKK